MLAMPPMWCSRARQRWWSKNGGDDVVVAKLEKNAIIGEIAILCDVPRTAGVRAATRLETLCIEKEHMLKLIHTSFRAWQQP
jgi:CRP-like cAMP-binding protein